MIGVSKPGAIGKPVPGHDVAVIRADGSRADAGELGQIAVRRPDPVMFLEYWGRPEATRAEIHRRLDDHRRPGHASTRKATSRFVGRDDDVITSSGYRIGPGEIEDCLIKHPAVALAAVIGKPDPVRTEIVKAFIVLKSGYRGRPTRSPPRCAISCRTRLSAHEYPREVVVHQRNADDDDRQDHPPAAARAGLSHVSRVAQRYLGRRSAIRARNAVASRNSRRSSARAITRVPQRFERRAMQARSGRARQQIAARRSRQMIDHRMIGGGAASRRARCRASASDASR